LDSLIRGEIEEELLSEFNDYEQIDENIAEDIEENYKCFGSD